MGLLLPRFVGLMVRRHRLTAAELGALRSVFTCAARVDWAAYDRATRHMQGETDVTLLELQQRLAAVRDTCDAVYHPSDINAIKADLDTILAELSSESALADPRDSFGHRIYGSRHASED